MDNEAIVDQIVRSLSFEVVAVPQDIIHINSTSKSTPLNVKIKVRKKNDAGLRHGVLSTPKVDLKDNVPDRIRLVSSDHTIMSFNVLMEADFDNVPLKHNKQNLNIESPGFAQEEENRPPLSKHVDRYSTPISAKRKKDVFGTCKPGGCLDPPFGEEKYSYQPAQQNLPLPDKNDDTNKLKSSSIFKSKLFKRKKKSLQDSELNEQDIKESPKPDSILSIYEAGSLQSSTNYSNSIMTYPHIHPSNSNLSRLEEEKIHKKHCSSQDKSNISVSDGNGSYFILPKKTKMLVKQNDFKKSLRNSATGENDFNIIKKTIETVEPKHKDFLRAAVKSDDKMDINSYKSSELNINELKYDSKAPNSLPIPLPIQLPVVLSDDKKESILENNKAKDSAESLFPNDNISSILDNQLNQKILLKDDNNTESIVEINKTKDGTESLMPNDDISHILDNQIKQKILLKDDNSKESIVDINKTKDGTEFMPIDDISSILDNQIKQKIPLKDDNSNESIEEINNNKDGTESLMPNYDICSILDNQIKQKILLKDDIIKESIVEINKTKDGTESLMPNDDISHILDNQIKQKILLKDDNNKESIVDINKTKDGTKSPLPNSNISPILDNPIKQKIPLNDEEPVVEDNKTESLNELLISNDNVNPIADDTIIQNISNLNSENVLEETHNSEDNSTLPDIKTLNYIDDVNEDRINTTDEIHPQDRLANIDLEKRDSVDDEKTFLTNQMEINATSPSTGMVYNSTNNKVYSEGSEIKSHLLVPTRDKPLLDLMTEPSQQVKQTEKVGDGSRITMENSETRETCSSEDLKNIWQNKTEPLESAADVVTKTTLPTVKSFSKDVLEIEKHLTYVPEDEQFSAGIPELKQLSAYSSTETFPYHTADTKIEVKPSIYSENSLQSTRTNDYLNHFESNSNLRKVKMSQENFPETDSKLTIFNLPGTDVTKITDGQSIVSFEIRRSVNKDNRKLTENFNSDIPKNISEKSFAPNTVETNNLIKHIVKDSEELSVKSNHFDLTSTTKSLSQTATDEGIQVNIDLSVKLSIIDLQNDDNMSDSQLMKFKTDEDSGKSVLIRFSEKNNLTTKELSGCEIPVNISSQSIIDTKSLIYRATVTDALNIQNDEYTKNILNCGVTETINQSEVDYMNDLTPYKDVKKSLKTTTTSEQLLTNNLSEILYKIPQSTTILRKGVTSWKMDIALQCYNDENNERVIKSFDSDNIQARRQNDALLVAQCLLRSESNEIKIPIDPENDLCVTIKCNKLQNIATTNVIDTNENSVLSNEQHKIMKNKMILPDSMENSIDYEYVNKSETKPNKKISCDIREVLTKIYEQELVPLQHIIKGLREEIDLLAAYQMKIKEKVPVTAKRSRPLKLVNGNKKCPCVRRF